MITNKPKGTEDLLPKDSYKWQYLEDKFRTVCKNFGYGEIRTPTFEHTELFERGVGDTTDVVEKQMYTFSDKADRSITLRPEGTASAVRAYIEQHMSDSPLPAKLFYNISCFRYERPQKGRLREFHQFGAEVFGAGAPSVDAEIISLAVTFLRRVGLTDTEVGINSIGCPKCRAEYNKTLKEYFKKYEGELCGTCRSRLERNPLRILDCKSEICHKIGENAPVLIDYLCDECKNHFSEVRKSLEEYGIPYRIDAGIVRGLDYYTKTVFEVTADNIGAKSAVCGGGRYDGLVEELGGEPTPGIGFGLGIERLLLALDEHGVEIPDNSKPDIFIAAIGESAAGFAQKLVFELRQNFVSAECDHMERSLRAQMKYAGRIGAKYSAVVGDNEVEQGSVNVKNMETGESVSVEFGSLAEYLRTGR